MSLKDKTLEDLLARLASDAVSPGSGAAAAVTLAFAAACAGKALAISRKHRPAEDYVNAAEKRLADIVRASLERADADGKYFESFIHTKDRKAADALLQADEAAQSLTRELTTVLDEIAGTIHPVVAGDIAAARALLGAASVVQERIRAENQKAAQDAS
jgi:formiminotetrahydrofolate cyclodeaminase